MRGEEGWSVECSRECCARSRTLLLPHRGEDVLNDLDTADRMLCRNAVVDMDSFSPKGSFSTEI